MYNPLNSVAEMTRNEVNQSILRGSVIVASIRTAEPVTERRVRFIDAVTHVYGKLRLKRATEIANHLHALPEPFTAVEVRDAVNRHIRLLRSTERPDKLENINQDNFS